MQRDQTIVPRRSLLYMPGANARALEKAQAIDCDTILFDLEDAVAPSAKSQAREQVAHALGRHQYGHRELVVRCNGLDTPWGLEDLQAFANAPVAALLFPKIESNEQINHIKEQLASCHSTLPIWLMIETPLAVLNLEQFAGDPKVDCLVMGTSDLVKALRAQHTTSRHNLAYALQRCVTVARAYHKDIVDGVHLEFRNLESFQAACEEGRDLGFDGKTLIHPSQVPIANTVFGFSDAAIANAQALLQAWQQALDAGKGVAELNGQLIESLHADDARRILAFAEAMGLRET